MESTKNGRPAKRATKARKGSREQQDVETRVVKPTRRRAVKRRSDGAAAVSAPSSRETYVAEVLPGGVIVDEPESEKTPQEPAVLALKALDAEHIYMALPPQKLRPLGRTMRQLAELLSESAEEEGLSTAAFEQRTQIALDTFRVMTHGSSRHLQSVIEALEPVTPADPYDVELDEAERRARIRLHALYGKIVADSCSVAELQQLWGVTRQRLAQLRSQDRLFAIAVPFHKGLLYPRWQFGADGRPRPIMANLIGTAKTAGLDPIDFHQLMSNPAAGEEGISPVQMLNLGQEELVLGIIEAVDA